MAIAELLSSLERDAVERIDALIAEARARAAAVAAESEARAARRRADATAHLAAELEAQRHTRLADARRSAAAGLLRARARLLDRIFDAAAGQLATVAGSHQYRRVLPRQLDRALALVGDADASVRCGPELEHEIRAARSAARQGLRVVVDPTVAGFAVDTDDGEMTVDGTLGGMLARERPELAIEVLRAWEAGR